MSRFDEPSSCLPQQDQYIRKQPLSNSSADTEQQASPPNKPRLIISEPLTMPSARQNDVSGLRSSNSSKKSGGLDIIDSLDGTAAFFGTAAHHDSPFDAVSTHRNRVTSGHKAPMAAFGRSKTMSDRTTSSTSIKKGGNGTLSARAQAAIQAMNDLDFVESSDRTSSSDHLLPHSDFQQASSSTSSLNSTLSARQRRNSDGSIRSVHLGFPAPNIKVSHYSNSSNEASVSRNQRKKAAQVAEAFGIQDSEAWEDYGRSHYAAKAPRESIYNVNGTSDVKHTRQILPLTRDQRAQRTASIWDMEASLREGVPVASVPAVPTLPDAYLPQNTANMMDREHAGSNHPPKRSKSLIQKMRRARNNPHNPIMDETADGLVSPSSLSPAAIPRSSSHQSLNDLSSPTSSANSSVPVSPIRSRSPGAAGGGDIRKSKISAPIPISIPEIDTIPIDEARKSSSSRSQGEHNTSLAQVTRHKSISNSNVNGSTRPRPKMTFDYAGSKEDARASVTMDLLNDLSVSSPPADIADTAARPVQQRTRSDSLMERLRGIGQ